MGDPVHLSMKKWLHHGLKHLFPEFLGLPVAAPIYCFHFALVVWLHVTENIDIYIYNVYAEVV